MIVADVKTHKKALKKLMVLRASGVNLNVSEKHLDMLEVALISKIIDAGGDLSDYDPVTKMWKEDK